MNEWMNEPEGSYIYSNNQYDVTFDPIGVVYFITWNISIKMASLQDAFTSKAPVDILNPEGLIHLMQ